MKQKLLSIFLFAIILMVANPVYSQTKTIEERLADLEKRVQALEAKLGTTQPTVKTQSSQPSEDIIKTAIKENLKKEVPPTWAGSLMGGKNAVIEKIEVQQIGNYNEQGKYWPIKCRVKGTCDAEFLFETKKASFDKIGDFKIKQDDYGRWYAYIDTF